MVGTRFLDAIWLIPLFPLFGAVVMLLIGRKLDPQGHPHSRSSKTVVSLLCPGTVLLSFLFSIGAVVQLAGLPERVHQVIQFTWLAGLPFAGANGLARFAADWGFLLDPLSAVMILVVSGVSFVIHVYSIGYMGHEGGYYRFFGYLNLFVFFMLMLVLANNYVLMFVGWEGVGLCSYLLIGFWFHKKSAADAGKKAFIVNRIGDAGFLLGLLLMFATLGTVRFLDVNQALAHMSPEVGFGVLSAMALLLFLGATGKSAQFPLYVWLPDAMEGPTPVSAMIHAATMVSAGVYMVIRMFPLISAGWEPGMPLNPTMSIIAFIGAFTALFAATIAVAQNDIKRVLAYSTISQLGYMIAALGVGAYVAAAFHLITHAFFKALLFLGSGSVIHGMEHGVLHTGDHSIDPQNMFNMGGLRKKMPITFWTFLIGGLALSGFPVLTAGFWSKDEILADAFGHGHWAVFATLATAAFLTAFYTMRQITLTFLGEPRTKEAEHAQDPPWTMTLPLVILAVFAIGYGWVGIPEHFPLIGGILPNWFHEFIGGTLFEVPEAVPFSVWPLLTSLGVALGGLFIGWLVYRKVKSPKQDFLQIPVLKNKWYFDEAYNFLFVRPAYWVSETFTYMFMDRAIIDGILHTFGRVALWLGSFLRNYFDKPVINEFIADGTGNIVKKAGSSLRRIQVGRIQSYMLVSLVVVVLFAVLYYFLIGGV